MFHSRGNMDGLFNVTDLNDFRQKSFRLIQETEGPKDFHKNLFGDEKQFQKKSTKSDFRPKYRKPNSAIRDVPAFIEHVKIILLDNGLDSKAKEFVDRAYRIEDSRKILTLASEYVINPVCPDVKFTNESGLFSGKRKAGHTESEEIDSSEIFDGITLDDSDFLDDDSYYNEPDKKYVGRIYQIRPGYVFRVTDNDGVMISREWISHPESKGRKDKVQIQRINWNFLKELDSPDSAEPVRTGKTHSGPGSFTGRTKGNQKLAEQIRKKAESLSDTIRKKLNPPIRNQNYTRRRANIASGIREEGERLEIAQKVMLKAAEHIEAGNTVPEYLLKTFESRPKMLNFGYWYKTEIGEYDFREPWRKKALEEDKRKIKGLEEALTFAKQLLSGESFEGHNIRKKTEKLNTLRNYKIPGFFPTPKKVISSMLDLIREITGKSITDDSRVLEPSAGKGDIAEELKKLTSHVDVCEVNHTLSDILAESGFNIVGSDFLQYSPGPIYDFIIMNPPFEKNQDSRHIIHAYSMLKPGGVIAAVASSTFNNDKVWSMFAADDPEKSIGIIPLEKGSFAGTDSFIQTGVNAVIVIVERLNAEEEIDSSEIFDGIDPDDSDFVDEEEVESEYHQEEQNEPEEISYHHIFGYPENEFLEDSAYVDDESEEDSLHIAWMSDIPYETARRAHMGTSFSPEKRAHQERNSYGAMLADVWKIRKKAEALGREKDFDADFERFRTKFRDLYISSLEARSRVLSPMISGPANFPTRRNQKANNSADARFSEMIEYRDKARKRFELEYRPETNKPIQTGAADSLQKLKDKLGALYKNRDLMKEANKIIRSKKDVVSRLMKLGISEADAVSLTKPDFANRIGFADYKFQNLSSEISRVKDRIIQEERLQTEKESGETEFKFDGGYIEADIEENRWKIFYDSKPDAETISQLKKNGWKWAPSSKAWQRFYTSWPKSRFSWIGITLQESEKEIDQNGTDPYRPEDPGEYQERLEESADEFEKEFIQELESEYKPEYTGNYKGRKYQETRDMDIAEIAKLIRNDIRDAIRKKRLPAHPKYSVTIERYSMGQSVTVRVKNILPLRILNEETVIDELSYKSFRGSRFNQTGRNMENILTDICRHYDFNESDSMTDYFHSRFHVSVSLETDPEYSLIKSEYERQKESERTLAVRSERPALEYRPKEVMNISDFRDRKSMIPLNRNENIPALRVNQPIRTVRHRQNLFDTHSVDDLFQNDERTIELNKYQDDSWRFPKKNDFQLKSENMQRLPFAGSSKRVKGERMNEDRKSRQKENTVYEDSLERFNSLPEEIKNEMRECAKKNFKEALKDGGIEKIPS